MTRLLIENPLLLLFVVAAIGYPLGRIKVAGSNIGVASVLFVGLAFGAIDPAIKLPEVVYQLGLVLFVYTVGLSSGARFFASFRHGGLKYNALVVGCLGFATALTFGVKAWLGIGSPLAAGLFAGGLTNTPALAAVIESLKEASATGHAVDLPVVGYSIAYPIGVIGMIAAIGLMQRLYHADYQKEEHALQELVKPQQELRSIAIVVTRPEATRKTLGEIQSEHGWDVFFGRMRHDGKLRLGAPDVTVSLGDVICAGGPDDDVNAVVTYFGELSEEVLQFDRSELDYRRVFVSNPKVAGITLGELRIQERFGAVITRIRRGDVEMIPHDDTVLDLGDLVRVLSRREDADRIAKFFGDSYRALSEIDVLTFSLGLGIGLVLGSIPVPLGEHLQVKLGLAGGPLIVALILGAIGRTGGVIWTLPFSANLTLRQIGLILFLAGVGTRAGYAFVETFTGAGGIALFAGGALITCATAVGALWVGHSILKIPMGVLIGILAGMQTQPAVLAYSLEQTNNELPNVGYATVYPTATIAKIILAQVVLAGVLF